MTLIAAVFPFDIRKHGLFLISMFITGVEYIFYSIIFEALSDEFRSRNRSFAGLSPGVGVR